MPRATLSKGLREEYSEKLQDTLDELDVAREKRRTITKALKGHEELLEQAIYTLRRRLKGLDLEQTEIPGTEAGEPRRDPAVQRILDAAAGIADREQDEDLEDEPEDDEEPNDPPTARGTKKFPLGLGLTERCTACGEEAGKHAGQKCPPKKAGGLPWRPGPANGTQVADVDGGSYRLSANMGLWRANWVPVHGASKSVVSGVGEPEAVAKAACEKHHLERLADQTLENAGAGELTKGELKGEAVARKAGSRG